MYRLLAPKEAGRREITMFFGAGILRDGALRRIASRPRWRRRQSRRRTATPPVRYCARVEGRPDGDTWSGDEGALPEGSLPPNSSATLSRGSEDEAPAVTAPSGASGPRYRVVATLGEGGMGRVLRVRDTRLARVLARKELRPHLAKNASARSRFVREAHITAQLEHPGIVPVHDFDEDEENGLWFTMKEVRGKTLGEAIADVHETSGIGPAPGPRPAGPSTAWFDAYARVCEAMAYAHANGRGTAT